MIDPIGFGALLLADGVVRIAVLLVRRTVLRDHVEIVRSAAALPPGTRIVVRQGDGAALHVSTGRGVRR